MGAAYSAADSAPGAVPLSHFDLVGTWACRFDKRVVVVSFMPDGSFEQEIYKPRNDRKEQRLLTRVRGYVSGFSDDALEVCKHPISFAQQSRDSITLQGNHFVRI
eukprot:m51a1_g2365 hypothetical protein (105) ;mRNA; r:643261-643849